MHCPKCNGKVGVLDSTINPKDNEIFRKRKCNVCGHIFYTIEFEVEDNERFREEYNFFYRNKKYSEKKNNQ